MISRSYDKEQIVPFIRHINLVLNKTGNRIGTPVDVLKKNFGGANVNLGRTSALE